MRYLLITLLLLSGCADVAYSPYSDGPFYNDGVFNRDEQQDPDCYRHYGAEQGYCDIVYRKST